MALPRKLFKQIQDVTGTLGHVSTVLPVGSGCPVELVPPDDPLPVTSLAVRMPWHAFTHTSDGSSCTIVNADTRSWVVVRLSDRSITVKQLLEAERALTPERKAFQVVDCQTSLAVQEHETVSARCLWLELIDAPPLVLIQNEVEALKMSLRSPSSHPLFLGFLKRWVIRLELRRNRWIVPWIKQLTCKVLMIPSPN